VDQRQATLDALRPWKAAHLRPAWTPRTSPGEPTGSSSKFCGVPWLPAGEAPPTCTLCGRDLQLFVQLDLDGLPAEIAAASGGGVLQLFYCVGQRPEVADDGEPPCWAEGAWQPFSDVASVARVVPAHSLRPAAMAGGPAGFPARAIVGWDRFEDVPHPADHDAAGLSHSYDFPARTVTLRCPSVGLDVTLGLDDLPVEDIATAAEKDKLGGWPCWVQSNEQPGCPRCGETMRLLFQLDSEDHVPFMFGDAGVGHVTQCPTHTDVVAFGWACS
jgi:hypothetical protein